MTDQTGRRVLHKGKSGSLTYSIGFDIGAQREVQQDAFAYVSPATTHGHGEVFVVADGMGGMAAGEKASYLVTQTFRERYGELRGEGLDALAAMDATIHEANRRVLAEAETPGQQGMGSTVVALAVENGRAWVAHVGDSRAYRLDDHGMHRITRDHSRVQKLVDSGILTEEQAEHHPDAHVLSQAVGRPDIHVDHNGSREFAVDGHAFLLCSDGLTGMLPDRIIELATRALPPYEAAAALMDLANALDASDNIAIAIVSTREVQSAYLAAFEAEAGNLRRKAGAPTPMPAVPAPVAPAPAFESRSAPADRGDDSNRKRNLALMAMGAAALLAAVAVLILTRGKEPAAAPGDSPAPPENERRIEQATPAPMPEATPRIEPAADAIQDEGSQSAPGTVETQGASSTTIGSPPSSGATTDTPGSPQGAGAPVPPTAGTPGTAGGRPHLPQRVEVQVDLQLPGTGRPAATEPPPTEPPPTEPPPTEPPPTEPPPTERPPTEPPPTEPPPTEPPPTEPPPTEPPPTEPPPTEPTPTEPPPTEPPPTEPPPADPPSTDPPADPPEEAGAPRRGGGNRR